MATDCSQPALDSKWKQGFRRNLLAWFAKHERDLPWRKSRDPYRVWVSEIMLQQTQVETVIPYFERFVKIYPTVEKLAAAEESEVLRLWEGLGYYRRARSLHAAARRIVTEHDGKFPRNVAKLKDLPGIGRYTAGAIASIAFNQRVPILEANTIRLLARLLAYPDDTSKSTGQRILWATAEELLPSTEISSFNQALMELGSLVCTPLNPLCDKCPVARHCHAFLAGLQHKIPASPSKVKSTPLREAAIVVRKKNHVLLRQCDQGERWAGLWDFVRFEISSSEPRLLQRELKQKTRELSGVSIGSASPITTIKHSVTRYRITLDGYQTDYVSGTINQTGALQRWVSIKKLSEYPLSSTGRKLAKLISC